MPKKRSKGHVSGCKKKRQRQHEYTEKVLARNAEVAAQRTAEANALLECPDIPPIIAHAPPAAAAG